ncbi:hypothetical protein P7K49_006119 [Saguinus oedipus]|uniref:Uncharacterized protein n=1 Tax=Saguinus oedipus TaxID=9490 RepID=A0ABQ9W3X5_SAGOE|nr:hypothetical protein P7K49_006119 [Saguinus oedipus]
MDASGARQQLRRRFPLLPDAEAQLDRKGAPQAALRFSEARRRKTTGLSQPRPSLEGPSFGFANRLRFRIL